MIINHTLNKIINKSEGLSEVLLDLSEDTVTENSLEKDRTAHDREGEPITGRFLVEDAEAWAIGTRDGVPVPATDETYHNNSKWYSNVAKAEAVVAGSAMLIAGEAAESAENSAIIAGSAVRIASNSAESARESSIISGSCANIAGEKAEDSEAWAVGKRNGVPVSPSDPTYHNNAEYYASQAGSQGLSVVANVEVASASAHDYVIGQQFIIGGILYIATAVINIGDEFVVGANCAINQNITEQIKTIVDAYVTGIKGNAETDYRTGNVNLTPANIGLTDNSVKDYNNNTPTKFGYSTSGMPSTNATWLGAWDASESGEYRLRAVKQADLSVNYAASAGNSAKLNGYASDTFATANTIVRRQENGYIYAVYYNQSSSEESSATTPRPCIIDASGWHRKASQSLGRTALGLGGAATYGVGSVASGNTGLVTGGSVYSWMPYRILYAGKYSAGASVLKTASAVLFKTNRSDTAQGPAGFVTSTSTKWDTQWAGVNFQVTWNRSAGTLTNNNSGYPIQYVVAFA